MKTVWRHTSAAVALLLCACLAQADAINPDKPFAEKHVLLQVSDQDPTKYNLTLDIANNLARHYGSTDAIDIQIVAFGGGAHMLLAKDNANRERIASMMASDIRFVVCLNTIDTITRKTGQRPELLEGVQGVQTGVAHMLDEIARGYTHIHP